MVTKKSSVYHKISTAWLHQITITVPTPALCTQKNPLALPVTALLGLMRNPPKGDLILKSCLGNFQQFH